MHSWIVSINTFRMNQSLGRIILYHALVPFQKNLNFLKLKLSLRIFTYKGVLLRTIANKYCSHRRHWYAPENFQAYMYYQEFQTVFWFFYFWNNNWFLFLNWLPLKFNFNANLYSGTVECLNLNVWYWENAESQTIMFLDFVVCSNASLSSFI